MSMPADRREWPAELRRRQKRRDAHEREINPDRISFGAPQIDDDKLSPRDRDERIGDVCRAPAKVIEADECGVTLIYLCAYCCEHHVVIMCADEPGRAVPTPCGPWRAIPDVGLACALALPGIGERRR